MNALVNFLGAAAVIIQIANIANVDVGFDLHLANHIITAATVLVKIHGAILALVKRQSGPTSTKRAE